MHCSSFLWVGDPELRLKTFSEFLNIQSIFLCRLSYRILRNLAEWPHLNFILNSLTFIYYCIHIQRRKATIFWKNCGMLQPNLRYLLFQENFFTAGTLIFNYKMLKILFYLNTQLKQAKQPEIKLWMLNSKCCKRVNFSNWFQHLFQSIDFVKKCY